MLTTLNDYRVLGEQSGVKTTLPKSFVGVLIKALEAKGHKLIAITSRDGRHIIDTDKATVIMTGSFSANDVVKKL